MDRYQAESIRVDSIEGDFALLRKADGKILVGEGPFTELEACPQSSHDDVAFYVNDFALSCEKPWKIPAVIHEVDRIEVQTEAAPSTEVAWDPLQPNGFAEVFSEINQSISRGVIEKSVPVATETGELLVGEVRDLLNLLANKGDAFYPYAYVKGSEGFCGQTPEVLFNLRKGRLNTMALAGTARAEERDVFAFDEKEIREHEFVAQTLVSKLSDIGMVTKNERSILDLGALVHFLTPIEVFLYGDKNIDELISRLHPTPALGPLPRTKDTMQQLIGWREKLGCPPCFGAPFGLLENGAFHVVVAIRGLHWNGKQISVPSGCGVIEASRLVNEWRELALKRSAVKTALGW